MLVFHGGTELVGFPLTPEQYLETERASEFRSEYRNGEMLAMPGGSFRHNTIVNAIGDILRTQITGLCHYATHDVRLAVPATGLYTYPDVLVICGEIQYADKTKDMVTNQVFLIEVLSPGTADYDRGRKFEHYRSIPSLIDYIVVSQDRVHVEHYSRQQDGSWALREYRLLTDTVSIASISASLNLAAIYEE
jgi:Uma2 family endonuclease